MTLVRKIRNIKTFGIAPMWGDRDRFAHRLAYMPGARLGAYRGKVARVLGGVIWAKSLHLCDFGFTWVVVAKI